MNATKSKWHYYMREGFIVVIDDGAVEMTVTNDIENVIAALKDHLGAEAFHGAMGVIYKDSEGTYDMVKVLPDGTVRFKLLNVTNEDTALRRARFAALYPSDTIAEKQG